MSTRSLTRSIARTLSARTSLVRPTPTLYFARTYTQISNRTSTQTLIHLSLDDAEDTPEGGEHVLTSLTPKKAGERVEQGEVLGYIEHTIRTEIVAPCSGSLQRVLYADGEQVELGDDLFVIAQEEDEGEEDEDEGSYTRSLATGASDLRSQEDADADEDDDAYELRRTEDGEDRLSNEDDGSFLDEIEEGDDLLEDENENEREEDEEDLELQRSGERERQSELEREREEREKSERNQEVEEEEDEGQGKEEADAEERKKEL